MKIAKAENYKRPHYAVAIAAALVAVTASGCGAVRLEGETTVPDDQVTYAGGEDVYIPDGSNDPVIYDGGLQVDPGYDEVELEGDVAVYPDETVGNKTQEYCEADDSELVLDGIVEVSIPESN